MNADALFIAGDSLTGANMYAYCNGNPVMYSDPSGLDCYYFYLDDGLPRRWSALLDSVYLMIYNQCWPWQVHRIAVKDYDDFKKGWDAMGDNIQTVVINMHGNPYSLGWEDGTTILDSGGVAKLANKKMERLIVGGCNAGHCDFKDTNIAAAFAKKLGNSTPVLASDGTVQRMPIPFYNNYFSMGDDTFIYWRNRGNGGNRTNLGWISYTYNGKTLSATPALGKTPYFRDLIRY